MDPMTAFGLGCAIGFIACLGTVAIASKATDKRVIVIGDRVVLSHEDYDEEGHVEDVFACPDGTTRYKVVFADGEWYFAAREQLSLSETYSRPAGMT